MVSPEALKGQVVTQVISVDNADASALARELAPLVNKGASIVASTGTNSLIVTDTASNVRRIAELVQMLDKSASNTDFQMFHLQHADATEVSDALNDLFGKIYGRGNTPAPVQPGQPQPPPQPAPQGRRGGVPAAGAAGQMRGAVVATADTRTNSVLVFASEDNMKRVAEIIRQLDDPAATALKTKIVKMQYADALEVSDTINTILSNSVGATSNNNQAASFRQRVFGGGGGRFGGFGGFGGGGQQDNAGQVQSTDPFAKVAGDARTNSLIITATDERMAKIDDLITQLDVPVPVEPTTFVIPVRNAQAQDLAYLLGQSFGTGGNQPSNPFGNNIFIGGGQQGRNSGFGNRQPINRRQGQSSSPFGRATGRAMPNMQPPLSDGAPGSVHGTMVPGQGFMPDEMDAETRAAAGAGQFFFGGRGGFGQQQQPTPQYGRGTNGQYSNFLQLRNNVGVVADPATNSLIITTTPDNLPALRQIIDQLDVVPRQVMIEVIIAEASLDAANKLGVQFEGTGIGKIFGSIVNEAGSSNFPLGTAGNTQGNISAPIQPGAQYGIATPDGRFKALIQALATDNKVRILSTPKIFTSNNMQAEIDITTQIPYITNSLNGGLGLGQSITYSFLPVGITLNVTPRIARDGLVTIDVAAEASDLLGFDTLTSSVDPTTGRATTQTAPRTSDRYADTEVSVRDGEIVVIGGLMRDSTTTNVNKVPLLGDIPIIGNLFRSTSTERQKTELMVFLIPHVVDSDAKNRQVVGQESAQTRKVFPDLDKQQPAFRNIPAPIPAGQGGKAAPAIQSPAGQPAVQPGAPAPGQPDLNPGDNNRPAGRP